MAALGLALALLSCGASPDRSTVTVSVIGSTPRLLDPNLSALGGPSTELLRATRQGLVAFDAAGQIEPALAESWTFTKDGLSIIFRVRRIKWPGGAMVNAADVAASLNAALSAKSTNRLKPLLTSIESVVAMTERVVEIRLRVPRPNLLELLAQPELGITRRGAGTGPWDASARGGVFTLVPHPGEDLAQDEAPPPPPVQRVILRGERAAMAIARFREQRGGLILGGTVADWPVVRVAQLRSTLIRFDPAQGLFGLAALPRRPFVRDVEMRGALSMAIDRALMVASFEAPNWRPTEQLLPAPLDSAFPPAAPEWIAIDRATRVAEARRRIAERTAARGPIEPLRVALPPGAGMTILFARLAADWRAIGVGAVRVAWNDPDADFRLIDEVAPNRSASWYFTRTGCSAGLICDDTTDAALKSARAAPDLAQRAAEFARADEAAARSQAFIPLATPLRWSIVDPLLTGFRENAFAIHPFASLRDPPR